MMRGWIAAGAFVLAGCAAPPPPPAAPSPPQAQDETADACGASGYQYLVGRPRTEIPVPVRPELQRVACLTCPVTLDYNPRRLNIFFDADTGVIKQVRCG